MNLPNHIVQRALFGVGRCKKLHTARIMIIFTLASVLILTMTKPGLSGAVQAANASSADRAIDTEQRQAPKPQYVPGEVIIKLKDGTAGRISTLSQDLDLQMHRATLSRLEQKYGVREGRPVFRQLHRLQNVRDHARGRKMLSTAPSL